MTTAKTDPLNFFWFLPTSGDGPYLGTDDYHRPPDNTYLRDVAIAADRLGFGGVLIPTGANCEDPWITAASIAPFTEKLKFLVAIRPGIATPAFYARQTAALDWLSNGRALLNIVVGGNPNELAGDGIFLPHDERYNHAREFFDVWQKLIAGERVQYEGRHIVSKGARLNFAPVQKKPPLYFGGSSDAAIDFAGERVEKYLTWGEPPAQAAEKIAAVRAVAEKQGRKVTFGMRLHFIVRETDDEAWAAADKLISRLDDATIIDAQERFARESDSVGQKRMSVLHNGRRDKLEISPNLWAGIGLVRGGAGTALVGSPETVAERIRQYQAIGIDTIIGSGYPHLEEAYKVAELLFPVLGLGKFAAPKPDVDAEFGPAPRRITGLAAAV